VVQKYNRKAVTQNVTARLAAAALYHVLHYTQFFSGIPVSLQDNGMVKGYRP